MKLKIKLRRPAGKMPARKYKTIDDYYKNLGKTIKEGGKQYVQM